ncbi:hypothetical protein [Pseudobdellovibrio sp. HCB154]|uniref:hypothetical protein n=1 Tax=Pseudobdellovibrio sp. HCB154 TaxID=3386277 RepID=UPI003916E117
MKHGLLVTALLSSLVGFSFAGCAEDHNQVSQSLNRVADFKISRRFDLITPQATPTVQVFNQANQPIANAQVLIGSAINDPFRGNLKITDKNGMVAIGEWTDVAHVTVSAQGYIRQTLLNQKPGTIQMKLSTAYMTSRPMVKGQVSGLPVKDGDKMMDFSLVIPTIAKGDLMNFDLDSVISPFTDVVDVIFGKTAELPSNVSLPTQKEKYNFLVSVTLSKPDYRAYALNYGPKTFYALTGRFPFKETVDQLQADKKFYEILNYFQFTNGGLRETTVTGPSTSLNIPGMEIKFDGPAAAIKGAAIQADEVVMAMTMNDLSGGRFVPSDVKRLNSNEGASLKTIAGKPVYIVNLLKKATDFDSATQDVANRSSASMVPFKAGMQSSLLPLLPSGPTVSQSGGSYKIIVPQASNKTIDAQAINELAVTVAISNVNVVQDGTFQVEMLDRKWEVLGTSWPAEITLPAWPLEEADSAAVKRKFEVNLIGSQTSKQTDLGDDLVKAATHVTKGAAEL